MDLSFARLIPSGDAPLPAADMAVLVAMMSSRLEASATAQVQAAIDRPIADAADEPLLAPAAGAFSAAMALRLADWRDP